MAVLTAKDFQDQLCVLSDVNKVHGFDGPDREGAAFAAGLEFLDQHADDPRAANCLFVLASMRSMEGLASYCLKKGAQIETSAAVDFTRGLSSALSAISECEAPFARPERTIEWLLKSGANVNARRGDALASACCFRNEKAIACLLKNGADPREGGGVAWFNAAWAHNEGGSGGPTPLAHLSRELPRADEKAAAFACAKLSAAATRLDIGSAKEALREIERLRPELEEKNPEASHWSAARGTLPRALRKALFRAHKHPGQTSDAQLLNFLRFLANEGLAFGPNQRWPWDVVSMAAHEGWRARNNQSRAFLDTVALQDHPLAVQMIEGDYACGDAIAQWKRIGLARHEREQLLPQGAGTLAKTLPRASGRRL